jgi:chromate reductase, NAD(P)H dehydrogenase (quinone)
MKRHKIALFAWMKKIKILGIPGSVRNGSSNHKVLKIISGRIPSHIEFSIYDALGNLPHFDGSENPPTAIADFLQRVRDADGIVICTPEYAFGVPGTLKNALDWTVGGGEFSGKPVVYITAATSGEHAHESLGKILTAIDTRIPRGGSLLISGIRGKLNAEGNFTDPELLLKVQSVVDSLLHVIDI